MGSTKILPTRVIAVGHKDDSTVRLFEPDSNDKSDWRALSHQWGTVHNFYTTDDNPSVHRNGIDMEHLPGTFKDAVLVTRALGCPYLWIDSLCIIQGPGGDFSYEAKRIEQVYNQAYCVLAASRSPGHYAGFLRERNHRNNFSLQRQEDPAPFYISESIDDFDDHVLNGPLNQRGWALQEHALARRTIFFTDHQTYFECGDGVRCKTMTKMMRFVSVGPRLEPATNPKLSTQPGCCLPWGSELSADDDDGRQRREDSFLSRPVQALLSNESP